MEDRALQLAIAKCERCGYDSSYVPVLYQEFMMSLELQQKTRRA